jgi:hypothetical protein
MKENIQFKEKLFLEFSPSGYVYKIISDNGNLIVLKEEDGAAIIASLIDKYAWWKIDISTSIERDDFSWSAEPVPEEHKYDFEIETKIRITLLKEKRVKSYYDAQPLPARLLQFLPEEVKREMKITRKQMLFIDSLLMDVDFLITDKDLHSLTKREASALIELLQALKLQTLEEESVPLF